MTIVVNDYTDMMPEPQHEPNRYSEYRYRLEFQGMTVIGKSPEECKRAMNTALNRRRSTKILNDRLKVLTNSKPILPS